MDGYSEEVLNIAHMYQLLNEQFKANLKHFYVRLTLWLANHLNIPSQLCCIGNTAVNGRSPIVMGTPTITHETDTDRHLRVVDGAIIYGGFNDSARLPDTPQILHGDIGDTTIGGASYTISENPNLAGLHPPSSVIIPLQDYREICFSNGAAELIDVKVSKGDEALLFYGDVSHGGKTRQLDENNFSHHASFHVYLLSTLHEADQDNFTLDSVGIANTVPQLLPMLKVPEQLHCVKGIGNRFVAAAKFGMENKGGTAQMATLVTKFAGTLLETLDSEQQKTAMAEINKKLSSKRGRNES